MLHRCITNIFRVEVIRDGEKNTIARFVQIDCCKFYEHFEHTKKRMSVNSIEAFSINNKLNGML